MPPWFCVQTFPNQEDQARRQLERQGFATFLPLFLVKTKNRHISVRNLFPGYLFVSFDDLALWPRVHRSYGVAKVLTYLPGRPLPRAGETLPKPPPMPDFFTPLQLTSSIESLRLQALSMDEIRRGGREPPPPRQLITTGCYVRVMQGTFAGPDAALVEWSTPERAGLLMQMFNRKVRVEFYQKDLQLVPPHA